MPITLTPINDATRETPENFLFGLVSARGYTGTGMVVTVIDTGVDYTHLSLRNSILVNPREVAGDRIVNALVSTAQQPPAMTMAAMASALEAGQQPRTKTARAFAALRSA